jgi:hypothetical protein
MFHELASAVTCHLRSFSLARLSNKIKSDTGIHDQAKWLVFNHHLDRNQRRIGLKGNGFRARRRRAKADPAGGVINLKAASPENIEANECINAYAKFSLEK